MRILIFGDVIAKPGRKALAALLPKWRQQHAVDFVLANVENLAHGVGATERTLAELHDAGVDCFTSGNHIWDKESRALLEHPNSVLLRPANYPPSNPGRGDRMFTVGDKEILVINLMGRVFFRESLDCPFRAADAILEREATEADIILVDLHAEATSEKVALGHYLDGRITALYGTHTHVPTADGRILPGGTAYLTDVGMTGLQESVIGANKDTVIQMFLTQTPQKNMHDTAESGAVVVNAMLLEIDDDNRAISWTRLQQVIEV